MILAAHEMEQDTTSTMPNENFDMKTTVISDLSEAKCTPGGLDKIVAGRPSYDEQNNNVQVTKMNNENEQTRL